MPIIIKCSIGPSAMQVGIKTRLRHPDLAVVSSMGRIKPLKAVVVYTIHQILAAVWMVQNIWYNDAVRLMAYIIQIKEGLTFGGKHPMLKWMMLKQMTMASYFGLNLGVY